MIYDELENPPMEPEAVYEMILDRMTNPDEINKKERKKREKQRLERRIKRFGL